MKRIKTTAANAVKNGLVKVGDDVMCRGKIKYIDEDSETLFMQVSFGDNSNTPLDAFDYLYIPKPEPKPIDFGKAGLVLKAEISIVKTTGYCGTECFSGIYLNGNCTKGFTSNGFIKDQNMWQDITETYYLNNPK